MKTKDRIVAVALRMFNEQGERAVTTNHIAAELGISPGNLYYHFNNKEAIIREIFKQYAGYIEGCFQLKAEAAISVELMMTYLDQVFEVMWQFRFFYSNLPELLSRDAELQQGYLEVQERLMVRLMAILEALCRAGVLKVDANYLTDLVHTIKVVVTFWISYQVTQAPQQGVSRATVYEGVLKVLFILKPYFTANTQPALYRLTQHYRQLARSCRAQHKDDMAP